jgi:DNA polymerase (family 10)
MASEKWRSEKVRRSISEAKKFAQVIAEQMPAGVEWHFGGSYARGAATVGDLDVIVVSEDGTFEETLFGAIELPSEGITWQRRGPKIAQGDLEVEGLGAMHVDFWLVKPAQRGAFLLFVQGPKELNIAQRTRAIKLGMNLSQNGLFRTGSDGKMTDEQLDDGTPESIYRLLGLPWMSPADREAFAAPKAGQVETIKVKGSDGKSEYNVMINRATGQVRCDCKGYTYRGTCKHAKGALGE